MLCGCFAGHWRHYLFFKARNLNTFEKVENKMIDRNNMDISFWGRNNAHGLFKHISAYTCCVSSVVSSSVFISPFSLSFNKLSKIKILFFGDSVLQMNTNKLPIALIYTKQ